MQYADKISNRSARAGRLVLGGVAAVAIRSALRPPLIAVAAISLAALAAIAAFAQTPAPVTPVSAPAAAAGSALSGLFEPYLADLKTTEQLKDAIKKAHRECYPPRVKFTIVSSAGDPLFADTLDRARQEQLQDALKTSLGPSLGLEPDQFKVDSVIGVVDGGAGELRQVQ